METSDEMRARIVQKKDEDDEFRSQLISDPRGAIEKELDVTIPDGLKIEVHEDSIETAHLILPPKPKLDETQLSQIAGGKSSALYYCM